MRLRNWLRPLAFAAVSRRPARTLRRPALEALEDRTVPSFTPAFGYAVGNSPRAEAVGDFNNDGKQDLVVANGNGGSVSVLLSNGDGIFLPAINTNIPNLSDPDPFKGGPPPLPQLRSVAVGDFNNDGNLDIVVTSTYSQLGPFNSRITQGQLTVLLGNGTGNFPTNTFYTSGTAFPDGVAVGDFDDDGSRDVVTAFGNFNAVVVLPGKGDGTLDLDREGDYDVVGGPVFVAIDDVNGDGKLDVVTANSGTNSVSVLLGNGDATLQAPVVYAAGTNPTALALGDVNGDGKLDLVTANKGSNGVSVLLGNGDGTFQSAVAYAAGTGPTAVALGDFNQDGQPDLAVTNATGVTVLLGVGDGTFRKAHSYSTASGPAAVAVGNFNGDAFPDLAVANAGANIVSLLLNNTDWTTPLASIAGPSSGVPNQVLTFTLGADGTGLPADTVFSYAIDWDSDGTVDQTVNGPSSTTVTHAFAANGSYTITVTATDADGHTSAPVTQAVTVLFAAGVTGPSLGARNQALTFILSATAAGLPADTVFSYAIDWNGDGTVDQTVSGPTGTTITHSYATDGSYTIKVTATVNGQTSAEVSLATTILSFVSFQADPGDPTKLALVVDGTAGADTIILSAATSNGVTVSMNGTTVGTFAPSGGAAFGHVIVNAGDGNDVVRLTGGLTVSALLFGGNGNDTLDALDSLAANVLQGGAGNDILTGGAGNDMLIGGLGADTFNGSGGDDIVIGGTTSHDSNQAALCAIMAEWSRTDATYLTRVSHLQAPPKGKGGVAGLNGSYFLNTSTVFDDAAIDDLRGGTGMDWFFVKQRGSTADKLEDRAKGETVTNL